MTAFSHQLFIEQAWEQKSSLEINSDLKVLFKIFIRIVPRKLRVAEKKRWTMGG